MLDCKVSEPRGSVWGFWGLGFGVTFSGFIQGSIQVDKRPNKDIQLLYLLNIL